MSPQVDFLGRLQSLIETFGYGGVLAVFVLGLIVAIVSLVRGTGFTLFLLFLAYALGAVTYGGVIYMATVARWGLLVLLGISVFRGYVAPRPAMFLIYIYAILGFLCVPFSPTPLFVIQQSLLLLVVVFTVSAGTSGYISSLQKLESIFKMGIFAAFVWTVASLLFVRQYMYATAEWTRFGAEEEMGPVALAFSGAFFAPMLVWGVVQNREKLWRIASVVILIPFVFVLFLTAVRSALFGMLVIASLPLLLMHGKPARTIIIIVLIGVLVFISTLLVLVILPDRAEYLLGRLLEGGTTGRTEIWRGALNLIFQDTLLIGRGIGAEGWAKLQLGHGLHNSYLTIWYSTGLLGLLLVLMFIAIYTMKAMRNIKYSPSREYSDISKVLLGYMLGIAAVGVFESIVASAATSGIVMLVLAASAIDRVDVLLAEQRALEDFDYAYWDESVGVHEQYVDTTRAGL